MILFLKDRSICIKISSRIEN